MPQVAPHEATSTPRGPLGSSRKFSPGDTHSPTLCLKVPRAWGTWLSPSCHAAGPEAKCRLWGLCLQAGCGWGGMWEGSVHTQGTMGLQTPLDAPGTRAPCAETPTAPGNRACSGQSVQKRPVDLGTFLGGGVGRACHPRRQVQGRPSSPRGTWLQSEAPSRVPAHDRGWAHLSPSDAPWGLSPTMAGVHQAPRDPRLEGGRGGDTSARHSPFPLEGSFSSKMTRCPSRLDIGAPRSRGSFSPLYKDSALSHSDRNFLDSCPWSSYENRAVPGSMESQAE